MTATWRAARNVFKDNPFLIEAMPLAQDGDVVLRKQMIVSRVLLQVGQITQREVDLPNLQRAQQLRHGDLSDINRHVRRLGLQMIQNRRQKHHHADIRHGKAETAG